MLADDAGDGSAGPGPGLAGCSGTWRRGPGDDAVGGKSFQRGGGGHAEQPGDRHTPISDYHLGTSADPIQVVAEVGPQFAYGYVHASSVHLNVCRLVQKAHARAPGARRRSEQMRLQMPEGSPWGRIGPSRGYRCRQTRGDRGGSRASVDRTGGSDARIWRKQHSARSRDNAPSERLFLRQRV